jgi:hypothetical protein
MRNGTDTSINSYNTHSFRVKFVNGRPSDAFVDFIKGPKEESVTITYDAESDSLRKEQLTRFDEVVKDFRAGQAVCGAADRDGHTECLVDSVYRKTQRIVEQTAEVTKFRDLMSNRLRNYTCLDQHMNTSASVSSQSVKFKGKNMVKEVLLDKPQAKIWYVKNFITPDECAVLMQHGRPRLTRATVAAADGSSVISENRKASQAHYDINPKTMASDPVG